MPVMRRVSFVFGMALFSLALAVLSGCAGEALVAGPTAAQMAGRVPPVPAGLARVWLLRQYEPSESLETPMIFVNGAPLASSQPGTAFFRDFAPGTYAFSVETCTRDTNQAAAPALAAGSVSYLEVQSLRSFHSIYCNQPDTFYVRAIPAERAQSYFARLTYLGAG
jgi:hypothetical protein